MDILGPQIYEGTLTLIGNGVASDSRKGYSLIELKRDDGQISTIPDVAISTHLDNYLNLGERVTLHVSWLFNLNYIHAIKLDGRELITDVPVEIFWKVKKLYIAGVIFLAVCFPIGVYLLYLARANSILVKDLR